jgi:hypothetical protein
MIQQISGDLLWSQIVAKAWCDEGLMKRLLSNPRDVLSEHGLDVPEGMNVRVEEGPEAKVEEEDGLVCHFILPINPPDELTDEDLDGHAVSWCGYCGGCGCRCRC